MLNYIAASIGRLFRPQSTAAAFPLGFNVDNSPYYSGGGLYANRLYDSGDTVLTGAGIDANGYPSGISGTQVQYLLYSTNVGGAAGYFNGYKPGQYVIKGTGTGATITATGGTFSTFDGDGTNVFVTTNGVAFRKTVTLAAITAPSGDGAINYFAAQRDDFRLTVSSSSTNPAMTTLRVHHIDDEVAADAGAVFSADAIATYTTASHGPLRNMQWNLIPNSWVQDASEIPSDTNIGHNTYSLNADGTKGGLLSFVGSVGGASTGTLSPGHPIGIYSAVFPNGESRLVSITGSPVDAATAITWTPALSAGTVTSAHLLELNGPSPEKVAKLAVATGMTLWLTTWVQMTDAALASYYGRVAAIYTSGLVYIEVGDELWNSSPPYFKAGVYLSTLYGLTGQPGAGAGLATNGSAAAKWAAHAHAQHRAYAQAVAVFGAGRVRIYPNVQCVSTSNGSETTLDYLYVPTGKKLGEIASGVSLSMYPPMAPDDTANGLHTGRGITAPAYDSQLGISRRWMIKNKIWTNPGVVGSNFNLWSEKAWRNGIDMAAAYAAAWKTYLAGKGYGSELAMYEGWDSGDDNFVYVFRAYERGTDYPTGVLAAFNGIAVSYNATTGAHTPADVTVNTNDPYNCAAESASDYFDDGELGETTWDSVNASGNRTSRYRVISGKLYRYDTAAQYTTSSPGVIGTCVTGGSNTSFLLNNVSRMDALNNALLTNYWSNPSGIDGMSLHDYMWNQFRAVGLRVSCSFLVTNGGNGGANSAFRGAGFVGGTTPWAMKPNGYHQADTAMLDWYQAKVTGSNTVHAYGFVGQSSNGFTAGVTSNTFTPTIPLAAGQRVVLKFIKSNTETITTVTDNASPGNTWTRVGADVVDAGGDMRWSTWEAVIVNPATTITGSFSAASTTMSVRFEVFQMTGINPAIPAQKAAQFLSSVGTSTDAITSGTLTPAGQPGVLVGYNSSEFNYVSAAGTGFTDRGEVTFIGEHERWEDKQITSTSAVAATFTGASGANPVYVAGLYFQLA